MIEGIFGNRTAEKVLLYLEQFGEGYAGGIAETFDDVNPTMARNQLQRFERSGVLRSKQVGRTRLYTWNPRYAFEGELRALLRKALGYLPENERKRYFSKRTRPRRSDKPS